MNKWGRVGFVILIAAVIALSLLVGYEVIKRLDIGARSAALVPDDAYLYLTLNTDSDTAEGTLLRGLMVEKSADPSWQALQEVLRVELGAQWLIDETLRDLSPWLGEEIAIYQQYPSNRSPFVFMLEVENRVAFDRFFAALKENIAGASGQLTERTYEKVKIIGLQFDQLINSVYLQGYWIVSRSQLAISNLIDTYREEKAPLAASDRYQYLMTAIPEPTLLRGVFDLKALIQRMIETGFIGENPLLARMLDALQSEMVGFGARVAGRDLSVQLQSFIHSDLPEKTDPGLYRLVPASVDLVWAANNLTQTAETQKGDEVISAADGTNLLSALAGRYFDLSSSTSVPGVSGRYLLMKFPAPDTTPQLAIAVDATEISDDAAVAQGLLAYIGAAAAAENWRIIEERFLVAASDPALIELIARAASGESALLENDSFHELAEAMERRETTGYFFWSLQSLELSEAEALTSRGALITLLRSYGRSIGGYFTSGEGKTAAQIIITSK